MPYIIQYQANTSYCLGVNQASAGTPIVLSLLQGAGSPTTQWEADPNTGNIHSVADPNLVIDYQGTTCKNGLTLILATWTIGRQQQRWNWVGNPPYIQSFFCPQYAIDNSGGKQNPGNKIQLWSQQSGNSNQWWQMLSVPVVQAAEKPAK